MLRGFEPKLRYAGVSKPGSGKTRPSQRSLFSQGDFRAGGIGMYRAHLFSGVALMALVLAAAQAQAQTQTAIELETINVEGESQATTRGDGDVTNDEPTVATKEETVLTTRVTRG